MNSFNRGASPRPTPGFPARSGIVSCGRGGFLPPRDPVETGRGRGFASRGRAVKTVLVFPDSGRPVLRDSGRGDRRFHRQFTSRLQTLSES